MPAKHIVGVDFGGTKVLAAVLTPVGDIVARCKVNTPSAAKAARHVEAISLAIEGAMADAGLDSADVLGVGVSIPGVVDAAAGRVVLAPNVGLRDLCIAEMLSEELGLPVVLGNDVNLGMLGEARRGAAKGADCAVGVFVGTGIGGGVLFGGEIWRGYGCRGGEIGHMQIARDGPRCACGNVGCLEALASRTAVERHIRQALDDGRKSVVTKLMGKSKKRMRSGVLAKAARRGDEVVLEALQSAATALGVGCVNVVNLLDPEVIVIGGGLIEACHKYVLPTVKEVVRREAMPGAKGPCPIVAAALGDDAVVHGAAILAQEQFAG